MLKFELTVNSQSEEGFKLKISAETNEETQIAKELTEKLIAKIEKITVNVGHENDENE